MTERETSPQRPDLPAAWTPAEVEAELYQRWVDRRYFEADVKSDKPPFTIVLPLRDERAPFIPPTSTH